MSLDLIIRYLHIASGFTALLIGTIPMFTRKGGKDHVRWGRVYFWAMTSVFFTAIPLSIIKTNYFLFSIAIFSYYACFSGWRSVKRKNQDLAIIDHIALWVTLITSIGMISFAFYSISGGRMGIGLILLVFGLICLVMSLEDFLKFYRGMISKRYGKRAWFFSHISRIGGSYIAAFTAFSVTNLDYWPPLINWLGPTLIGTIILTRVSRRYYLKFNSANSSNLN